MVSYHVQTTVQEIAAAVQERLVVGSVRIGYSCTQVSQPTNPAWEGEYFSSARRSLQSSAVTKKHNNKEWSRLNQCPTVEGGVSGKIMGICTQNLWAPLQLALQVDLHVALPTQFSVHIDFSHSATSADQGSVQNPTFLQTQKCWRLCKAVQGARSQKIG